MSEPWIGLVEIAPNGDCALLDPGQAAFINIVTLASSSEEFAAKIERCMTSYNAVVLTITHCLPYAERIRTWEPNDEIKELVARLTQPAHVFLSTINKYPLNPQ